MSGCHTDRAGSSPWWSYAPVWPRSIRDVDPMLKDVEPRLAGALGYPFEAMQVLYFQGGHHPDLDGEFYPQIFRSDEGHLAARYRDPKLKEAFLDQLLVSHCKQIKAALWGGRLGIRASSAFGAQTTTMGLELICATHNLTLHEASRRVRFMIYGRPTHNRALMLLEHPENPYNDYVERFWYQSDVGLGVIK